MDLNEDFNLLVPKRF